jgi:membrane-associated protease RseP (regulator of RpoE activity)
MEISVEHGKPILAQFDLGNGSPLLLFPSYWTAHDLQHGRPSTEFLDGGVGGLAPETEISVDHLSVGGFTFEDVPTGLINADTGGLDSVRVQANIGLPVFRRFRLAIDFPHERLYVAPEPDMFDRPFDKDRAGLRIEPVETGGIVRFVAPGSPAAAQGWQIGDQIAEVDGKALTLRTLGWRLGEPGTKVVLDGTDHIGNPFHRELVLATFY